MLVNIVIVVAWALGSEAVHLSVGEFVHFQNIREKLFVSTDGQVQEILKGGVLVKLDPDSDICEVYVQELRTSSVEDLFYSVKCSSLVGTDLLCPPAPSVPDNCGLKDIACLAESLFTNGYAVMTARFPSFPHGNLARNFAAGKLGEVQRLAAAAGMEPDGLDFHFSDVSSRGPGRWEIGVRPSDLAPGDLDPHTAGASTVHGSERTHWLSCLWEDAQTTLVLPVLHATHQMEMGSEQQRSRGQNPEGRSETQGGVCGGGQCAAAVFAPVFDGVLVSVPGADTQHWHRDSGLNTQAPSHYTVYIPTVDVTASMGPTQFLPGTNRDFTFRFTDWTSFFDYCPTLRAPLLKAGSMLIWEYRTVHRGTRNVHISQDGGFPGESVVGAGGDSSDRNETGRGPGPGTAAAQAMRAMLYRTYHLQGSWRDINMGDTSFYEEAAKQIAAGKPGEE